MGKNRDVDTFKAFGLRDFTAHDLAKHQGIGLAAAQQRVARMVKRGVANRLSAGRRGQPARYEMASPTIARVRKPRVNRINVIRCHFDDTLWTLKDAASLCDATYRDINNWLKRGIIGRARKNANGEHQYCVIWS